MGSEMMWMAAGGVGIAGFILVRLEVTRAANTAAVARCHERVDELIGTCVKREELTAQLSKIERCLERLTDRLDARHASSV